MQPLVLLGKQNASTKREVGVWMTRRAAWSEVQPFRAVFVLAEINFLPLVGLGGEADFTDRVG